MHIHLPKPLHGWREFLGEVGVIVIGVLIALGAEQVVEALHHRAEVHEARHALNEELSWNLTSFQLWDSQLDCMSARLNELERWRASWENGRPIHLMRPIPFPSSVAFRSSVWRVSAGEAVSRMPFSERVTYARLYDGLDLTKNQIELVEQLWADIMTYEAAKKLSVDQLLQVNKDIRAIRGFTQVMRSNFRLMSSDARSLSVGSSHEPVFASAHAQALEVCKPLLSDSLAT